MQDITQYSDDELSLLVFNDEHLYRMRHNDKHLARHLNDQYIYTIDQLRVLQDDIEEDSKEA